VRTWLVIAAVAAIAIVAAVNTLVGHDGPPPERSGEAELPGLRGPGVPVSGALAGTLYFVAEGCRVERLDLSDLARSGGGVGRVCAFSLSPDGDRAAIVRGGAREGEGRYATLVRLSPGVEELVEFGPVQGSIAWAPDSRRLAWCDAGGTTHAIDADGRLLRQATPGCRPRFGATGALLTATDAPAVLSDGVPLLDEDDLRSALPPGSERIRVLGFDQRRDGTLAVVTSSVRLVAVDAPRFVESVEGTGAPGVDGSATVQVSSGPRLVLQIWRGDTLEQSTSLRSIGYPFLNLGFGEVLRFSPGGNEIAVGAAGIGVPIALVDAGTLRPILRPTIQQGFAWSPDGRWFAIATGDGVHISSTLRSEPVYVLPIAAVGIAWR
jgi:hypothetical protein